MMQHARIATAALGIVLPGCSTLADLPSPAECVTSDDCPAGFACDETLNICRDATFDPPVRYLGFDIQEGVGGIEPTFRLEVAGCDVELIRDASGTRSITAVRGRMSQTLQLWVFDEVPENLEMPDPGQVLPATFVFHQPSRFRRSPTTRTVVFAGADAEGNVLPGSTDWARYHPDDALPRALGRDGFVLTTIAPTAPEGITAPAPRYEMFNPPITEAEVPCTRDADCCPECEPEAVGGACVTSIGLCRPYANPNVSYRSLYQPSCDRVLEGDVVSLVSGSPIVAATIDLRHADLEDGPPLTLDELTKVPVDDRPVQCRRDSDCVENEQICNRETSRCELLLAGRSAATGRQSDVAGHFSARVYTYCDDQPNARVERAFTATILPPSPSPSSNDPMPPWPTVSFGAQVQFDPEINPGTNPSVFLPRKLCIPDLGPEHRVRIALSGSPRVLANGPQGEYRCCDVACLPANRELALEGPPAAVDACTGRTTAGAPPSVSLSTTVPAEEIEALLEEHPDCEPPLTQRGVAGTLDRRAECPADQALCEARGLAAGHDDAPRKYTVRVETPTGSLLRSTITTFELGDGAEPEPFEIVLPRRHLLRGAVRRAECQREVEPDGDCGAAALVLAERLRVAGETTANTPGPYFHEVPTHYDPGRGVDGAYTLPLDPGVYVVTALPVSGSIDGPSTFAVVDLRGGDAERDFVLEPGVYVTFDASGFDRRSRVLPLDLGSWTYAGLDLPPGLEIGDGVPDLNDTDTCMNDPASGPVGCRIRRAVAGSSLPLTQVKQVRFVARDVASSEVQHCR